MNWTSLVALMIGILLGAIACSALWRRRLAKLDLQLLNLTETVDRLEEEAQTLRAQQRHCEEHHGDIEVCTQKLLHAEAEIQTLRQRLRIAKTDIDLEHARNAAAEARIRALEAVLGQQQPSAEAGESKTPPSPTE